MARKDDALARPWAYNADSFQAAIGVKQPWIAEISPYQYHRLSKRGKAEYDKKNRAEWEASARAKDDWHDRVVEAFNDGRWSLSDPAATDEAKRAVRRQQMRAAEAQRAHDLGALRSANKITSVDNLRVGDRVFSPIFRGYAIVEKINRVSVLLRPERGGPVLKSPVGSLQRLSERDLRARLEANPALAADLERGDKPKPTGKPKTGKPKPAAKPKPAMTCTEAGRALNACRPARPPKPPKPPNRTRAPAQIRVGGVVVKIRS